MITLRGTVLLLLALVSVGAATVVNLSVYLELAGSLLALLGLALLWAWAGSFGYRLELECPRQATAGETLPMRFRLHNRIPLARGGIHLRMHFPAGGRRMPFIRGWFRNAPGGGQVVLELQVPCEVRGRHELRAVELQFGDPLGLVCRTRSFRLKRTLDVVPAYRRLRGFPFVEMGVGFRDPRQTMPFPGFSSEFYALRPYQHGDSPRWIHWPSSLRRQALTSRQFQTPVRRRILVVLDCVPVWLGLAGRASFELAVSAAASVIRFAVDTEHEVGLLEYGRRQAMLAPGGGPETVRDSFLMLARTRQDGRSRPDALARVGLAQVPSVILVLSQAGRRQRDLALALGARGLAVGVVLACPMTGRRQERRLRRFLNVLAGQGIPSCRVSSLETMPAELANPEAGGPGRNWRQSRQLAGAREW